MNMKRHLSSVVGSKWLKIGGGLGAIGGLMLVVSNLPAALGDYNLSQSPLYLSQSQPPLMMMVMSRDEQLFNKAYSDYTDLNPDDNDGIETTYKNSFEYAGYFDSKLCYAYTTSSSTFKATGPANGHYCDSATGRWSGNFLNWATMSRLDILRQVLYGGQRSTDTGSKTILERAPIPNDLHAWVKVYSGSDLSKLTPQRESTISICNATTSATSGPLMQVAVGDTAWTEWASTAGYQCGAPRTGEAKNDAPASATNMTVRVEVCDPAAAAATGGRRESFCRKYSDGSTDSYKPAGLLQEYGESGRLRFGLISGTYANPRDGGVLRKNIGKLAGNSAGNCTAGSGDEINLSTGQFCTENTNSLGSVIQTISNFKLEGWNYSDNWAGCNDYGILNRQGQGAGNKDGVEKNLADPGTGGFKCSAWGNPLAEMYSEALRYFGDIGTTRTAAYSAAGDQSGLATSVAWLDPYRAPTAGGNSYCAACNILVMSSGLPSFDSDNVQSVPRLQGAAAATTAIGVAEGINGQSYSIGRVGATPRYAALNTHEDICTGKTVTDLGLARGICPDIPSMEGSYLMAGLAYAGATTDLRPGLQGKDDATHKVTTTTYAVAMAETLPKFDIALPGGKISLAPLCQANNSGTATAASGNWRSCFLGSVGVGPKIATVSPKHVYGRQLRTDGKAGSFSLVWEDSLWGNDHDNDVVSMLTYCIGATCDESTNPRNTTTTRDICWRADGGGCAAGQLNVGDNEVLIRIENLSAYAGNAMLTGYSISGSNADGVKRLLLRPGNSNGSVLSTTDTAPTSWAKAQVLRFRLGTSTTGSLESPLWYAAKYGGFNDKNKNGIPDAGEWDSIKAGSPDNYFLARNPTELGKRLGDIFEAAAGSNSKVSGGSAGARISTDSLTVTAGFNVPIDSNDWTGDVSATRVAANGTDGAVLWSAAAKLDPSARRIYMVKTANNVDGSGANVAATAGAFTSANIPGTTREQKLAAMGLETIPTWFGSRTVDTLIGYLKGGAVANLRTRSSLMGDVVNSSPVVVTPRDDYGFGGWAGQTDLAWKDGLGVSYKAFLTSKLASAKPMVYVGANDGMLHGFDASNDSNGGVERFGFIPSTSLAHMAELANPSYVHRYYVDGLIATSDVYYGSSWKTVLVGSTGAGAASVAPSATVGGFGSMFGLDVSAPATFDQTKVLWEITGKNDSDMGFALGKPIIVPIASATGVRFVAIFGNGINSASGRAVLFVVDIQTGQVLAKLRPTDAAYAGRNGVMNVAAVSLNNSSGLADTVYAGDMQGNIWKYDLSSATPSAWSVAFSGTPLFTAAKDGAAQPITGGIEVAAGPGGGVSLFFGTGRYFAVGDNTGGTGMPVQSLYGITDDLSTTAITTGRAALVGQALMAGTASGGYEIRGVTNNPVSYVTKRGWYVDLKVVTGNAVGERFIGTPSIQNGKVFFTTFTPGEAACSAGGGVNWLYGLDILSGAGGLSGLSLTPGGDSMCTGNCGGVSLNNADNPTSPPVKDSSIFVPKLAPCDPTDPACTLDKQIQGEMCTFVLRAVGAPPLYMPRPCGRQSWRQVR